MLTVRDDSGAIVRRITGPREKGFHRVAWDLHYPASTPTQLEEPKDRPPWACPPTGPLALPGTYTVALAQEVDGVITPLTEPRTFNVIPLELATFAATDRAAVLAFQQKVARLQRAVRGALEAAEENQTRLAHLRKAFLATPAADPATLDEIHRLDLRLNQLLTKLRSDQTLEKREEPRPPSIKERVDTLVGQWRTTSPPTRTQGDQYRHAATEFTEVLTALRVLVEEDLRQLEARLEAAGAPWTPGRLPAWEME